MRDPALTRLPLPLLLVVLCGAAAALFGGYWDDAWHTERGRDQFLIAPHVLIYGGVAFAGGALAVWTLRVVRSRGLGSLLDHRPLGLGLLSVTVTLASGPIDNAWHLAFGRDSVIWSPPHVFGILGSAGIGIAVLAELRDWGDRSGRWLRPLAGGFVLAAFNFLVVEYETDVPQFDSVWYLPALGVLAAFALGVVGLLSPRRFAGTEAALVQLFFVAAVGGWLLLLGFDAPKLPLLVAPAAVLDLSRHRLRALPRAALFVVALYVPYVFSFDLLGEGVRMGTSDVLIGVPIAFVAVAAVFAGLSPRRPGKVRLGVPAAGAVMLLLVLPASAGAHDPGQGPDRGSMRLVVSAQGRLISLDASPAGGCRGLGKKGELVARRAGRALAAPLQRQGCSFRGRVKVPSRGRWFVYADLRKDGQTIESWLPLKVGSGRAARAAADRYAYRSKDSAAGPGEWLVGGALYLLAFAFLLALAAVARAESAAPAR